MNKVLEKIRWKLYTTKANYRTQQAAIAGKIRPYSDDYLDKMSNYYYHGIPGSIILMSYDISNGRCMELGPFQTLGIEEDFTIIYAYINSIKYNPSNIKKGKEKGIEPGKHCFIEVTTNDNQKVIYDPTRGLIYDKEIYYEIERPQIFGTLPKKEILKMPSYEKIKNGLPIIDEYALENIIPILNEPLNITTFYKERLLKEIDQFFDERKNCLSKKNK